MVKHLYLEKISINSFFGFEPSPINYKILKIILKNLMIKK